MTSPAPTSITPTAAVALRPATADDATAIHRVAALDSAAVPVGPLLVGVMDGEISAAVSLATGEVVADPFKPTAAVVELLVLRAAHLRPARARAHTPAQTLVRRARHGRGRRRAADVTST